MLLIQPCKRKVLFNAAKVLFGGFGVLFGRLLRDRGVAQPIVCTNVLFFAPQCTVFCPPMYCFCGPMYCSFSSPLMCIVRLCSGLFSQSRRFLKNNSRHQLTINSQLKVANDLRLHVVPKLAALIFREKKRLQISVAYFSADAAVSLLEF